MHEFQFSSHAKQFLEGVVGLPLIGVSICLHPVLIPAQPITKTKRRRVRETGTQKTLSPLPRKQVLCSRFARSIAKNKRKEKKSNTFTLVLYDDVIIYWGVTRSEVFVHTVWWRNELLRCQICTSVWANEGIRRQENRVRLSSVHREEIWRPLKAALFRIRWHVFIWIWQHFIPSLSK